MKTLKTLASTALLTTLLTTGGAAQAEGFFSKLFSAKDGAGFTSLLSHVPADTAYLFANENAIPEDVMNFHLKRAKEVMGMMSNLEDMDKVEKGSSDSFLMALMNIYSDKLANGKIEDMGISLKAHSMIYGLDMTPIMRLSYEDKDKVIVTMKEAEEKSGYKLELTKCGDYDCLVSKLDDDKSFVLAFLDKQMVGSVYSIDDKDKIFDHITGKSSPKEAYSEDKWEAFLKENDYKGYGDGFVDLKRVYQVVKPMIAESIKKDAKSPMDDKELENCMAVAEDHVNNVPEIIFGTKNMETHKMDYELLVKTESTVSATLQTLANDTNIAKRLEKPIFDFGLNINFMKLRDALTQYSTFLIESGENHKCKSIDPKEIRKGMGGVMMGMNMGLGQIKSLYAAFNDIELDEKTMQPKSVDALVSIGTDDPAGLFGMVSMMAPPLMGKQLPADGKPIKLPDGVIPSKGMPVPPIYLSRGEKSLNIMIGNDKPKLKDYSETRPIITFFGMDGKRYYEKLATAMKAIPSPDSGKDKEQAAKIMETLKNMMGDYQQEVTADKRGLVVNYRLNYK